MGSATEGKKRARIGVFGGTFDPIHIGHLVLAENARRLASLDRVLFMPVSIQPFKQDRAVSDADDRLRMLYIAIETNKAFDVCKAELEREGVSYTIDSLRAVREEYAAESEIVFILGADMFANLEKWYKVDELLSEFEIVVGRRPGTPGGETEATAARLRERYGARITQVPNPLVEVSGTEIRAEAGKGESIRYLVPDGVWHYLRAKNSLPEKKFAHVKRVMDLAVKWAEINGVDIHLARTAALLHDIKKDKSGGRENDLMHGRMAARVAREELGVLSEDVLNAISWHTTGRGGMSKLELIIFAADTVEPGRTYEGAARLRELCEKNIEEGALQVLTELRDYLADKGIEASPETEAAIEDLRGRNS